MHADDMIMISVDDHLVEPPDLFENHLPASYARARRGAAGPPPARRVRRLDVQRPEDPEHRAQRRGRAAQGGVRHRADRLRRDASGLLEHPRPHQGHERRRRAGLDVLPVVPGLLGPGVRPGRRQGLRARRAAGLQRLARRRVVRRVSGPVHPHGPRPAVGPRRRRRGGPAPRDQGRALGDLHREPRHARLRQLPQRLVGPAVGGVLRRGRRRVDPPRLVGPAGRHGARRPHRRDDHVAAHEHLPGRRRPAVVAHPQALPRPPDRPVRGRHRLDPLLPRPPRPHLRHAPPVDRAGLRRPAAERRVPAPLPDLLHLRPRGREAAGDDRHRQHRLGVRLPAQRLVVARRPRGARRRAGRRRRARRRGGQDHPRERHAVVLVRPVRAPRPASSARSAPCAPRPATGTCRPARTTRAASRSPTPAPTSGKLAEQATA